jgi:GntR family transcriptional regulator
MFDPVEPKAAVPIYRQIIDQIRRRVAAGLLSPGDQLPSVRELAAHLLVNPNTAAKVYRDLERDGLLETRRGQGTFVSAGAESLAAADRRRLIAEQLLQVARDVRAFGLSRDDALALFREILQDEKHARKDRS